MLDPRCPQSEKDRLGFDWDTCTGFGDYHDFWSFYREAVAAAPPNATIVEVGCYAGRSLTCLGAYARAANKRLRIVGVDNDNIGGMQSCRQNIARSGLNNIELVAGSSTSIADQFGRESCWLVFIDAEHLHEAVEGDIRAWMPKVSPNGWLAGHDFYFYTVHQPVCIMLPNLIYDERWQDIWIAAKCEPKPDADIRTWIPVMPPFTEGGWKP